MTPVAKALKRNRNLSSNKIEKAMTSDTPRADKSNKQVGNVWMYYEDGQELERDLAAANAKFAAKPDVAKLVERVQSLRAARHEWEGASSTELLLLDAVVEALLSLSAQLAEKEANLDAANARADKNEKDAGREA